MTELPILFSEPMVIAILEDRKTQTRRVVKLPKWATECNEDNDFELDGEPLWPHAVARKTGCLAPIECPYGQPGDRLYVKETFYAWGRWETRFNAKKGRDEWHFVDTTLESGKEYRYAASHVGDNGPRQRGSSTPQWWKRPAIFMPRSASRILLERTTTAVERLNDISEADAVAEGWVRRPEVSADPQVHADAARDWYSDLWEQINGPGSWAANPWVWVVEFRRVKL